MRVKSSQLGQRLSSIPFTLNKATAQHRSVLSRVGSLVSQQGARLESGLARLARRNTSVLSKRHAMNCADVLSFQARALLHAMIVLVAASSICAQHSNDKGIPAESKPGQSSASTYARDKIETVNLANGNFSLYIPLTTVGGRGSVAYTIALSYNSKVWSAQQDPEDVYLDNGAQGTPLIHYSAMYEKERVEYDPGVAKLGGGWTIRVTPGIKGKTLGIDPISSFACSRRGTADCGFRYALTKLWLSLPDGSQVELRDSLTQGAPALTTHIQNGYHLLIDRARGRVWRSTDGSNVIFIRDANDPIWPDGGNFLPSGWVFLPDGSRMRMDQGAGSRLIDRNGNFITLGPTYTDQLGRQTLLEFSGNTVTLTMKGYLGAPDRSITINTGAIGNPENLRADFRSLPRPFTTGDANRDQLGNYQEHTIQGPHTDLFIESEGIKAYGTVEGDDVGARTAVTQLNLLDGRSFAFRYNQYGEVAKIIYPGGGVSHVDYSGFITSACEVSAPIHLTLNRRVISRVGMSDGVNVDATWIYAYGGALINGVPYPTVTVSAHPGEAITGPVLTSDRHFFLKLGFGAEYRPCGGPYTGTGNEKWQNAKEFRTEVQTGTGTIVTVRNWEQRAPVVWANDEGLGDNAYVNQASHAQDQPPNDDRVTWEETTLEDGKVKRVEYGYDQFNNVTSTKEYDFGTAGAPGSLLRQTFRTFTNALNGYCYSNLNPLDSTCGSGLAGDVTSIIYQPRLLFSETVKDAGGNQKSFSQFEYDNYTSQPNHAPIFLNSGMIQYDGSRFATFNSVTQPRGNATKITRWLNGGTDVVSYGQYDNAGQVVWSKDPNGNVSTVSYTDNFGIGTNPDPAAGVIGAAGPTFALASITTNALGHQVKTQYDYSLGAAAGVKDANGVITKTEYDSLGRPFRVTSALGLAEQSVSEMSYPNALENTAKVSKKLDASRWLASKSDFDGFDRPIRSWQAEDGQHASLATFSIRTNTIYDPIGRVKQVTNPYRPATEMPIYTTTAYDQAGRVVSVKTPDGAVMTTSHNGNVVTVSDQTQRQRKIVTDALGRLKEVYEDPSGLNYLTSYGYDTLDNLTSVLQGSQTRIFVYDSLKRLTGATNPESGTTAYQYDANGNLKQKTDARGVVCTYSYDALNRNTSVSYTNDPAGTPTVNRYYDGLRNGTYNNIPYSKGRLWQTETGGSSASRRTRNSFDALGRPLLESRQFYLSGVWGQPFTVQRTYNLAGNVTAQIYPSGHTVSYSYDAAGRASSFTGNLGDGTKRSYSSEITYSPLGGMVKEKLATDVAIYNKLFYNSRGQLAEIRESTSYTGPTDTTWNRGAIINHYSNSCWGMCGGSNSTTSMFDNNGNLKKQEVYIPNNDQLPTTGYQTWWQHYDYDKLNRVQHVHEYTGNTSLDLQQEYVYDRYGNRTIHQTNTWGAGVNKRDFTANATSNRLSVPAGQSGTMTYDAAGNLTTDTYSALGVTRTYDAENRMTSETQQNNLLAGVYTYDADGQRVRRKVAGVETWQVFGMDGELLAEYAASAAAASPQKEYGYRNGQLLVTAGASAQAALPEQNVTWTNVSPTIQVNGNSIQKVSGTNSWFEAGASSSQAIAAGDGYMQFTPGEINTWRMCGLGNNDTSVHHSDIDYAFYVAGGGVLQIWESGNFRGDFGSYAASDRMKVAVEGGVVKYYRNATLLYTSTVAPTYPLQVDTSLNTVWSGVYNVVITSTGASSTGNIKWLVTDQLGTPRMVFDKTGALATVKRHDYLPFGEELSVGQGARTTALGYGAADGVRQKFTQKERDNETGLDYFLARYYSSTQGRFTSPDEFKSGPRELFVLGSGDQEKQALPYAEVTQPQSLNKYTYAYNNPLRYVDPDGHCGTPSGLRSGQVGICVASYIQSVFVPPGVPPGRGDGRGPNGQGGTSRVEVRVAVDLSKGTVTKTDEAMGSSGAIFKEAGPRGKGGVQVSPPAKDEKGNLYFQINQHGESRILGALGSIDNHLNMVVTPDEKVGITPSSTAKDYPSLEVFKYTVDDKGKVTTTQIFVKTESGNLFDMGKREGPIKADPR